MLRDCTKERSREKERRVAWHATRRFGIRDSYGRLLICRILSAAIVTIAVVSLATVSVRPVLRVT